MKSIRFLLFLALSALAFAPAAFSAEPLTSTEQSLVGVWEEYEPSSNVVQFNPDHTMKIYLTEEEGAEMHMHFIEATWTISPKDILTLNFSAEGKEFSQSIKLVFQEKEMWLVEEGKGTTKHRRVSGEIPEKYRW